MLKTSPLLSSSASASPVISFRHASSSNTYADPPTATLSSTLRRASSRSGSSAVTSVTSPASSRLARHESMDSLSVSGRRRSSSQNVPSNQPPPSPRPQTMAKSASATATSPVTKPTIPPPPEPRVEPSSEKSASVSNATTALSPIKRRSSLSPNRDAQQPQASGGAASVAQSTPLKRAKTDEQPPKVLPKKYEFCPVEDMVELISQMLAELIATNDAIQITSKAGLTRFHSRTPPGISVKDYLQRLARHATIPPPLLLVMVYYIDRLCAMYPEFTINTLTVHRFLITAATVAAKGLSDSFWNNTTYARVGGVRLAELKLLELEFLHRVDWKIVPNPEVLDAYYRGLIDRTPGYVLESTGSSDSGSLNDDDEEDEVSD